MGRKKQGEKAPDISDAFASSDLAEWKTVNKPQPDWVWDKDPKTGRWIKVPPTPPLEQAEDRSQPSKRAWQI